MPRTSGCVTRVTIPLSSFKEHLKDIHFLFSVFFFLELTRRKCVNQ